MSAGEPWRLLLTWAGEPGWNMALDEALLESSDPRPVLRFYTWSPAALSLGYFQRFDELAPRAAGTVLVRRFSGGGAIHHADELTFALAAPESHALYRGEVRRSYERVHGLLARAFTGLGVEAELRGEDALLSDRAGTGMCFHESTPLDLAWGRRKGVGSAQRRRGGRVLHHGSIKLGVSALEEGVAALNPRAPESEEPAPKTSPPETSPPISRLEAPTLAERLITAFEHELGCVLAREAPTARELEHAQRRADFYRSDAFLRRR